MSTTQLPCHYIIRMPDGKWRQHSIPYHLMISPQKQAFCMQQADVLGGRRDIVEIWYRTQGIATISPFGSKRVKVTYNNADEPGERMFAIMFDNTEHQNDALNALRAIGAEIGVRSSSEGMESSQFSQNSDYSQEIPMSQPQASPVAPVYVSRPPHTPPAPPPSPAFTLPPQPKAGTTTAERLILEHASAARKPSVPTPSPAVTVSQAISTPGWREVGDKSKATTTASEASGVSGSWGPPASSLEASQTLVPTFSQMMLTEDTPPKPKAERPAPKAARPAPPTPTKSMHPKTRAANSFPDVEESPAGKPTSEMKKVQEVKDIRKEVGKEVGREVKEPVKQMKKEEPKKESKPVKPTQDEDPGYLNTLLSNKRDAFNMSELADTINQATQVIETSGKGTDMYYSSHLDVMRVLVDVLFGDAAGFEDLLFSVANLKSAIVTHTTGGSASSETGKVAVTPPSLDHSNPELSDSMLGSGDEPAAPIMTTQQSDIVVPMHPATKRSRTTYDSQQSSLDDTEDGPSQPTANKKR